MVKPSLPSVACRLHPAMRCWLAQDTMQQGTFYWLKSPACFVAVLETLPWPCTRLLGHCGKKTQRAVFSLISRTLQFKFKDVFPESHLKVNQRGSVQRDNPEKRACPEICLQRMAKYIEIQQHRGQEKLCQFPQRLREAYKLLHPLKIEEVHPSEPSFISLHTHSLTSAQITRKFKSKLTWFNLVLWVEKEK